MCWRGESRLSQVLTMKTDMHYWPTWELRRGRDGEWARLDLE